MITNKKVFLDFPRYAVSLAKFKFLLQLKERVKPHSIYFVHLVLKNTAD
jgi:hypothetical protein